MKDGSVQSKSNGRPLRPLAAQFKNGDILIRNRLITANDDWECYVSEIAKVGCELIVHGLFIGKSKGWGSLSFSEIKAAAESRGTSILLDSDFVAIEYGQIRSKFFPRAA